MSQLGPPRGQLKLGPRVLGALQGRLRRAGWVVEETVLRAKVPILKLRDPRGSACDLSCNNMLPVFNTRLLKSYSDLDSRTADLVRQFKAWTKERGAHGAPNG